MSLFAATAVSRPRSTTSREKNFQRMEPEARVVRPTFCREKDGWSSGKVIRNGDEFIVAEVGDLLNAISEARVRRIIVPRRSMKRIEKSRERVPLGRCRFDFNRFVYSSLSAFYTSVSVCLERHVAGSASRPSYTMDLSVYGKDL